MENALYRLYRLYATAIHGPRIVTARPSRYTAYTAYDVLGILERDDYEALVLALCPLKEAAINPPTPNSCSSMSRTLLARPQIDGARTSARRTACTRTQDPADGAAPRTPTRRAWLTGGRYASRPGSHPPTRWADTHGSCVSLMEWAETARREWRSPTVDALGVG